MGKSAASKPRAVLLGSGDRRPQILDHVAEQRALYESSFEIVAEDFRYEMSLDDVEFDVAIVLGGDGSILRAAKQMGLDQHPVLGVNLGKLGFLADVHPDDLPAAIQCVVSGDYSVTDHLMMRCQVFEGERLVVDQLGLNEAAILGGPPFTMQQIELTIDGQLATSYLCDGLIVSTPIGSTAHNLSAGGPILRKDLHAFVISPISPHTLTVRPVVDTADRVYDITVSQPNDSTCVVLDGQVLTSLTTEHRVRITRAKPVFQMIRVAGNSYYRTLREKLGWGGRFGKSS